MNAVEANFDGLIGPTHNYAGLSFGNIASAKNARAVANPKEAALQGLAKMKHLADLGLMQGVLPPHARPHLPTLRELGFTGTDREIITKAANQAPEVLRNVYAASAMWTANAATISPSADSSDGKVHITPANLAAMFHRSIEHPTTGRILKAIFHNEDRFTHHPALPGGIHFGDEGAANHNRFCNDYGDRGLQLFIYGRKAFGEGVAPEKFPGRKTWEASHAISRLHQLDESVVHFAQQNPHAIDAGAFHNDVVAVANRNVFFYHEEAFIDARGLERDLRAKAPDIDFQFIEVPKQAVPLQDAIKSYLFNSQLVSIDGRDKMTLILPMEAKETASTNAYLDAMVGGNGPIGGVEFLDVRQSMRNGGGPACLRLRVVMTEREQAGLGANVLMNDKLYSDLTGWVEKNYRDRVTLDDLNDPDFAEEVLSGLDALTAILMLGPVFEFQR